MSKFVEIPPEDYSRTAFDKFSPQRGAFDLDDARALMWMSQLAYESDAAATIKQIAPLWSLERVKQLSGLGHAIDTRVIVAERAGCTIVAFEGTDPALAANLLTDINVRLTTDDVHRGFQAALMAVWPTLEADLRARPKPFFFTGHSLGAALAVLAAEKASDAGMAPAAVYTFGMPRAGGPTFAARYNAKLGDRTFRLVHGGDTVPCIPDAIADAAPVVFRHVGRMLKCVSGGKFDRNTPLSNIDSDDPRFVAGVRENLRNRFNAMLAGRFFAPAGPGALGRLFAFLPFLIRDHLPDRYLRALEP
jgi:hypothetical protein